MTFNIGNEGFVINLKTILFEYSAKRNAIVVNFIDEAHPVEEVNRFIELYNKVTDLKPMETAGMQDGKRLHILVYPLTDEIKAREKAIYGLLQLNEIKVDDFKDDMKKALVKLIYKV